MVGAAHLLLRPTRDKKAYRLRCRFKIEPHPQQSRLDLEKVRIAAQFVRDLHAQGWDHLPGYGFRMRGPFPMVTPTTIHVPRLPSARQMLSQVRQGARFLDPGSDGVSIVPALDATEWWEYEIGGVFTREEIVVEYANPHEEERR